MISKSRASCAAMCLGPLNRCWLVPVGTCWYLTPLSPTRALPSWQNDCWALPAALLAADRLSGATSTLRGFLEKETSSQKQKVNMHVSMSIHPSICACAHYTHSPVVLAVFKNICKLTSNTINIYYSNLKSNKVHSKPD